jgi:predicted MFS family arabinose efflux permease
MDMTMNKNLIKKIIIIVVALSGVIINTLYGIGLLKDLFPAHYNNEINGFLISGIALNFGWAALLGWMIFKPFERRHILLLTIIPMLLANILQSANNYINLHTSVVIIALNIGVGFLYSALWIGAYFLAKVGNKD